MEDFLIYTSTLGVLAALFVLSVCRRKGTR